VWALGVDAISGSLCATLVQTSPVAAVALIGLAALFVVTASVLARNRARGLYTNRRVVAIHCSSFGFIGLALIVIVIVPRAALILAPLAFVAFVADGFMFRRLSRKKTSAS
jgi:hypothetical protein